jgi:hypothetical protein
MLVILFIYVVALLAAVAGAVAVNLKPQVLDVLDGIDSAGWD